MIKKINTDLRLKNLDLSKFGDLDSAIIAIILEGDALKIQAFANSLSIIACTGRPSVRYLVKTGVLKDKNVIAVLLKLIEDLVNYYDTTDTDSVEQLAWQIYTDYQDFSIADFLKFFDLCKRKEFGNEYQHIASKGINVEFMMDWLRKYQIRRRTEYSQFKYAQQEKNSKLKNEYSPIDNDLLERYHELVKKSNANLATSSLLEREEIYFHRMIINFNYRYFNSTLEVKKKKAKELISSYKKDFMIAYDTIPQRMPIMQLNEHGVLEKTNDMFLDVLKEDGTKERLRATTMKKETFVQLKMQELTNGCQVKFNYKEVITFAKNKLERICQKNDFVSGEHLLCVLAPEIRNRGCFLYNVEGAKRVLIKFLLEKNNRAYRAYWVSSVKNSQLPIERAEYLKKELWNWLATKYTLLINNNQNVS